MYSLTAFSLLKCGIATNERGFVQTSRWSIAIARLISPMTIPSTHFAISSRHISSITPWSSSPIFRSCMVRFLWPGNVCINAEKETREENCMTLSSTSRCSSQPSISREKTVLQPKSEKKRLY